MRAGSRHSVPETDERSLCHVRMTTLTLKIPPPLIAGLIALAMWMIADHLPAIPPTTLQQVIGGPIALFGAAISAAGAYAFWRAHTTINPMHPERSTHLVTSGVYRLSRNPMYLGLVITLAGWAIHLPWPLAFAGPLAFALYIHHFQILPEERILASVFGNEYEHYRSHVRRWL